MIRDEPLPAVTILRRFRPSEDGDVIALFPELPADVNGYDVTSYIGYVPIIRKRRTYAMFKRCQAAAREVSR